MAHYVVLKRRSWRMERSAISGPRGRSSERSSENSWKRTVLL